MVSAEAEVGVCVHLKPIVWCLKPTLPQPVQLEAAPLSRVLVAKIDGCPSQQGSFLRFTSLKRL